MNKLDNFGDVFPPRDLGAAENWGRAHDERVQQLERAVQNLRLRVSNEGRALGGRAESQSDQLKILSRQQEILEEQQLLLGHQQVDLEVQQVTLLNQQETLERQQYVLEQQQDELSQVVSSLPITGAYSSSISNFSIPSGDSNRTTISIPVPSGKTTCNIFAVGQAFYFAENPPIPESDVALWRIRIQTTDGPWGTVIPLNMDGKSTTFMFSRSISLSSADSFVPVYARTGAGRAHPASPQHSASLYVTATFS